MTELTLGGINASLAQVSRPHETNVTPTTLSRFSIFLRIQPIDTTLSQPAKF